MTRHPHSESELILAFFDQETDLLEKYEIYSRFRIEGKYVIAVEMRKVIEQTVRDCEGFKAWWKAVLEEERFSDQA